MRILFTTVPLSGHFYPLVPLAWACRTLGHDVLVATSENFVPAVLRSGLPAVRCGPSAGVADLAARDDGAPLNAVETRYAHGRAFGRIADRNLLGIAALVRSWRPDLVVSERAEFAGPIAAAASGIPHVEFHWGVPPLPEYRSAATRELASHLARLGLDALPHPVATLDPWPPSLRLAHAVGHQGLRCAPYSGDTLVPEWTLAPRPTPRICLTLGTVLPHLGSGGGSDVVLALLDRLAVFDVELVVAVDDEVAASWPSLPAAVRHVGRLPLSHVLGACDVVVNHGGQGSTLTALQAAVPQVVLPHFDDQFDNADAVVRSGAGVRLLPAEVTPDAVADSCLALLDEPRYGLAASAVADEIADQPSAVEVVSILEDALADIAHMRGRRLGDAAFQKMRGRVSGGSVVVEMGRRSRLSGARGNDPVRSRERGIA